MNLNKAREFYSSYYENTLEPGLRQSFERKLHSDATVQAEYRAFVLTIEHLNSFANKTVEEPFDLHDRITAKLDKHVWERSRTANTGFWTPWFRWAAGGVAALALIGAVLSFNANGSGFGASIFPGTSKQTIGFDSPNLSLVGKEGSLRVRLNSASDVVEVVELDSGKKVGSWTLKNQALDAPLKSDRPESTLVAIRRLGQHDQMIVALPSATSEHVKEGQGSLRELTKAMATFYGSAVQVEASDLDRRYTWKFDAQRGTDSALEPDDLTVAERGDVLVLRQR